MPPATSSPERTTAIGLAFAIGAYGLWGFLPLFFRALAPAGAIEIVAARILFSLVFCVLLLTVTRGWKAFVDHRAQSTHGAHHGRCRRADPHQLARLRRTPRSPITSSRRRSATSPTRSSPCCSASSCCASGCARCSGRHSASARVAVLVLAVNYGAVPVDRPRPRVLVRPLRLHQEERRRSRGCRQRPHPRDRVARAPRRRRDWSSSRQRRPRHGHRRARRTPLLMLAPG